MYIYLGVNNTEYIILHTRKFQDLVVATTASSSCFNESVFALLYSCVDFVFRLVAKCCSKSWFAKKFVRNVSLWLNVALSNFIESILFYSFKMLINISMCFLVLNYPWIPQINIFLIFYCFNLLLDSNLLMFYIILWILCL